MKRTHNGKPVHPADATLPEDAHGWTLCQLHPSGASYTTWLAEEDQPRAQADGDQLRREVGAIKRHADADEACYELGLLASREPLRWRRTSIELARYRRLWPLRESTPPAVS